MAAGQQAEILRTCVRAILRLDAGPGGNCTETQMWKVEEAFQILLRGFVRSRPSNEHLLYLLGHFDICLLCGSPKAKALANRSCVSLLTCGAAQPTVQMHHVLASVFNRSYGKPALPVQ